MTLIKSAFRDNKATGEFQFALLQSILRNYDPAKVDPTISPTETMTGDNYMWVSATCRGCHHKVGHGELSYGSENHT